MEQAITDVYGTFKDYLLHRHFGSHREKDSVLMNHLGFEYQVDMISVSPNGEEHKKNISVRGKSISESSTKTVPFLSFLHDRQDIVKKVVKMFSDTHIGAGIFSY